VKVPRTSSSTSPSSKAPDKDYNDTSTTVGLTLAQNGPTTSSKRERESSQTGKEDRESTKKRRRSDVRTVDATTSSITITRTSPRLVPDTTSEEKLQTEKLKEKERTLKERILEAKEKKAKIEAKDKDDKIREVVEKHPESDEKGEETAKTRRLKRFPVDPQAALSNPKSRRTADHKTTQDEKNHKKEEKRRKSDVKKKD